MEDTSDSAFRTRRHSGTSRPHLPPLHPRSRLSSPSSAESVPAPASRGPFSFSPRLSKKPPPKVVLASTLSSPAFFGAVVSDEIPPVSASAHSVPSSPRCCYPSSWGSRDMLDMLIMSLRKTTIGSKYRQMRSSSEERDSSSKRARRPWLRCRSLSELRQQGQCVPRQ